MFNIGHSDDLIYLLKSKNNISPLLTDWNSVTASIDSLSNSYNTNSQLIQSLSSSETNLNASIVSIQNSLPTLNSLTTLITSHNAAYDTATKRYTGMTDGLVKYYLTSVSNSMTALTSRYNTLDSIYSSYTSVKTATLNNSTRFDDYWTIHDFIPSRHISDLLRPVYDDNNAYYSIPQYNLRGYNGIQNDQFTAIRQDRPMLLPLPIMDAVREGGYNYHSWKASTVILLPYSTKTINYDISSNQSVIEVYDCCLDYYARTGASSLNYYAEMMIPWECPPTLYFDRNDVDLGFHPFTIHNSGNLTVLFNLTKQTHLTSSTIIFDNPDLVNCFCTSYIPAKLTCYQFVAERLNANGADCFIGENIIAYYHYYKFPDNKCSHFKLNLPSNSRFGTSNVVIQSWQYNGPISFEINGLRVTKRINIDMNIAFSNTAQLGNLNKYTIKCGYMNGSELALSTPTMTKYGLSYTMLFYFASFSTMWINCFGDGFHTFSLDYCSYDTLNIRLMNANVQVSDSTRYSISAYNCSGVKYVNFYK